jgi:hypothetical protein
MVCFLLSFFENNLALGSGKTQLCNAFMNAGFWVLDEAFLDMPSYALHPQSLLMETTWVCSWYGSDHLCTALLTINRKV